MAAPDLSRADILAAIGHSSLEWMLTDPCAFGLKTASALQRAVCRIADGRPLGALAKDPGVRYAIGNVDVLGKPRELSIISGVRTAKSIIAAASSIRLSQACDVSGLTAGEVPRVPIVSLTKDLADVVFSHVLGGLSSPLLKELVLEPPTADAVLVRHPSGRPIEIKVVAGAKAGGSIVARWCPGVIFDEFPRMNAAGEAVVNWNEMRDAAIYRLLPGGQIINIGSPYAPFGPAYEMVLEHWRKPTSRLVVVKAPAWVMNPVLWTQERVEAAKGDPDVYRTDVLAEFTTPEEGLLPLAALDAATRKHPEQLPPEPGCTYVAAMDPATRGNGWTLVVGTRKGNKKVIVFAKEWRGSRSQPLNPDAVLQEMRADLEPYGVDAVDSDQHMGDALVALGRRHKLRVIQWPLGREELVDRWLAIRTRLLMTGEVELPPVPQLRTDLLHLRKRVTQNGIQIVLPPSEDGRHCDYAPPTMLVLSRFIAAEKPNGGKTEDPEMVRLREQVRKKWSPRGGRWE